MIHASLSWAAGAGCAFFLAACSSPTGAAVNAPDEATDIETEETIVMIEPAALAYEIVAIHPHDDQAFTQGLFFHDGMLYESTGRYGQSTVRRVALETGAPEQVRSLPREYFAEGMTLWQDKILLLTWRSGIGFVLDRTSFTPTDTFRYPGEGWGLTSDGEALYLSDGTSTIRKLAPETRTQIGIIEVTYAGVPLPRLNELEWIDGLIWANIWQTDRIIMIDPESGQIVSELDLSALYPIRDRRAPRDDVLNGIAYDAATGRIFVTGKNWPSLFEIKVLGE